MRKQLQDHRDFMACNESDILMLNEKIKKMGRLKEETNTNGNARTGRTKKKSYHKDGTGEPVECNNNKGGSKGQSAGLDKDTLQGVAK
jgi:hypothetical protein